jgi:hypothetical protein
MGLPRVISYANRFMGVLFRFRACTGLCPPALAPPSGCWYFRGPPEVSAIAATSGYCLPTLRVEERKFGFGLRNAELRFMEKNWSLHISVERLGKMRWR